VFIIHSSLISEYSDELVRPRPLRNL